MVACYLIKPKVHLVPVITKSSTAAIIFFLSFYNIKLLCNIFSISVNSLTVMNIHNTQEYVFHCFSIFHIFVGVSFSWVCILMQLISRLWYFLVCLGGGRRGSNRNGNLPYFYRIAEKWAKNKRITEMGT